MKNHLDLLEYLHRYILTLSAISDSFKKWKIFCVQNKLFPLNDMSHQLKDFLSKFFQINETEDWNESETIRTNSKTSFFFTFQKQYAKTVLCLRHYFVTSLTNIMCVKTGFPDKLRALWCPYAKYSTDTSSLHPTRFFTPVFTQMFCWFFLTISPLPVHSENFASSNTFHRNIC